MTHNQQYSMPVSATSSQGSRPDLLPLAGFNPWSSLEESFVGGSLAGKQRFAECRKRAVVGHCQGFFLLFFWQILVHDSGCSPRSVVSDGSECRRFRQARNYRRPRRGGEEISLALYARISGRALGLCCQIWRNSRKPLRMAQARRNCLPFWIQLLQLSLLEEHSVMAAWGLNLPRLGLCVDPRRKSLERRPTSSQTTGAVRSNLGWNIRATSLRPTGLLLFPSLNRHFPSRTAYPSTSLPIESCPSFSSRASSTHASATSTFCPTVPAPDSSLEMELVLAKEGRVSAFPSLPLHQARLSPTLGSCAVAP
jgi:hypothetical protein